MPELGATLKNGESKKIGTIDGGEAVHSGHKTLGTAGSPKQFESLIKKYLNILI